MIAWDLIWAKYSRVVPIIPTQDFGLGSRIIFYSNFEVSCPHASSDAHMTRFLLCQNQHFWMTCITSRTQTSTWLSGVTWPS